MTVPFTEQFTATFHDPFSELGSDRHTHLPPGNSLGEGKRKGKGRGREGNATPPWSPTVLSSVADGCRSVIIIATVCNARNERR